MKNKTELLAPASSYASVVAAVNSGCDAIYIGGRTFNARAFADSPDDDGLKEIIDSCHLRGVKVFITLNTLYKNSELQELMSTAHKYYEMGADAFIVQDMGFFLLAKKFFHDIEIHCSTQMTIHNTAASVFFDNAGAERVVLSRELSLDEIKNITSNIKCDTECFVHGALCVSYSGRCLMSSIIGGRSGNRGRCAQPCRMEYSLVKDGKIQKSGYLLSPKDISTVDITDKLCEAGIYSFKIEGRMKSPEYAAQVVSSYRSAIDGKKLSFEDLTDLKQVFNRGGSSTHGYYDCFAGNNMLSPSPKSSGVKIGSVISSDKKGCVIKTDIPLHCGDGIEIWNKKRENTGCGISRELSAGSTLRLDIYGEKGAPVYRSFDKNLSDRLKKANQKFTRQSEIKASLTAKTDMPLKITLTLDKEIEITGGIPMQAQNKPMTAEDIISRLSKTGDTPFKFNFTKYEVDDGLFIPVSVLNNLKRAAVEEAEKHIISSYERKMQLPAVTINKRKLTRPQKFTVFAETLEQLEAALNFSPARIYVELNADTADGIITAAEKAHINNISIFAALPRIERDYYHKEIMPLLQKIENSAVDGYLSRNFPPPETKKQIMYDYTFNAFNTISADYFRNITLSPELTAKELSPLAGDDTEIVVYGRLVLMSTHQCPVGNGTGNKNGRWCSQKGNSDKYFLKDRTGEMMPILTHCRSCTAFILNSKPLYLAHKMQEIKDIGSEFMRLDFTTETYDETQKIMSLYTKALDGEIISPPDFDHTSGHYFRRVQ